MNRLRFASIVALLLHAVAAAAMALVLRYGLETNSNFQDRLLFIANHRTLWTCAWLTWTAAAIAILYFYLTFCSTHQLPRLAVLLTAAAIAPDLSAQAIEIGVLPGIAAHILNSNAGLDLFIALHRTAVMLSGYTANGLYSLSALILAFSARHTYPAWVSLAGIGTGCFGLALSGAALMDSASGMFWTNVLLIPSLLLWLAGVAYATTDNSLRKASSAASAVG